MQEPVVVILLFFFSKVFKAVVVLFSCDLEYNKEVNMSLSGGKSVFEMLTVRKSRESGDYQSYHVMNNKIFLVRMHMF